MRPVPIRRRFADWPQRLAEVVEARRDQPFAWGQRDCGMWAADVTVALAGWDPLAAWRGAYDSEAALEAILGAEGLEAFLDRLLAAQGVEACDPAFAARGDWCLILAGNQPMLGVVVGETIAVTGLDGLRFVPRQMALRAWAM